jgi:hypothetical protein
MNEIQNTWEFGKGALSANDIFSATTTRQSERVQTRSELRAA